MLVDPNRLLIIMSSNADDSVQSTLRADCEGGRDLYAAVDGVRDADCASGSTYFARPDAAEWLLRGQVGGEA